MAPIAFHVSSTSHIVTRHCYDSPPTVYDRNMPPEPISTSLSFSQTCIHIGQSSYPTDGLPAYLEQVSNFRDGPVLYIPHPFYLDLLGRR